MKSHLVTFEEVTTLGRPIGNVDKKKIEAYITEVEQMYIKPTLGESLFMDLLNDDENSNEVLVKLLEGGMYDDNGNSKSFQGLKKAISYYVYAQNVMSGDFQSTRYGLVIKDGDYSTRVSSKERSDHYNNSFEVARFYLSECVEYCKSVNLISKGKSTSVATGGIRIRKIG